MSPLFGYKVGNAGGMKGLHPAVYANLITKHGETHEHAEGLKCFEFNDIKGKDKIAKVRVVEPRKIPKNLEIKSYTDLDTHPELILYEGYYNKDRAEEVSMKKVGSD